MKVGGYFVFRLLVSTKFCKHNKTIEPMPISKSYLAINYDFRPISYWSPAGNLPDLVVRNVKGRNRREMIRDFYNEGNLEALCDELLSDTLNEEVRDSIGRIHPSFMGGEYLPNYTRHEVEIARIELKSTTSDVISIRARPRGKRLEYAVCDEYGSEFSLPQRTSRYPFSLRQLISFLDAVEHCEAEPSWNQFGFVLSYNQCNLDCGAELESLGDFTRVSSDLYPDLGLHYAQIIAEWYNLCRSNALSKFHISQSRTNSR
jgi:hypothetical protein